jgi:hypothetical protein
MSAMTGDTIIITTITGTATATKAHVTPTLMRIAIPIIVATGKV